MKSNQATGSDSKDSAKAKDSGKQHAGKGPEPKTKADKQGGKNDAVLKDINSKTKKESK
ncbi:hypothetical protein [Arsukibacterium sp.]|uniref:hypothetical protein n=1 Tax=Arsukibacterium sp. TaxID=1977258 RepID=UPI002FD91898